VHLSLTTFVIEIVNFLVLVWILWRLFIGPVRRVILERKASVAQMLKDSEKVRADAGLIRAAYENRLKDWAAEKEQDRARFRQELEEEKTRPLKVLETDLEKEKEKFRSRIEQETSEIREALEKQAIRQALSFSSRFLSGFASPELESRIVALVIQHLGSFGTALAPPVGEDAGGPPKGVVRSAFPLTAEARADLAGAIARKLGTEPKLDFAVDPTLVAGLEIDLGGLDLKANIRDELRFFSESGERDE
jgi:F-type H+-transporting ATPase subunit b